MADVLVLVDLVDSSIGKPTFELLTLAARLGTPVAVVSLMSRLIRSRACLAYRSSPFSPEC